jgi:hypothetical protein
MTANIVASMEASCRAGHGAHAALPASARAPGSRPEQHRGGCPDRSLETDAKWIG